MTIAPSPPGSDRVVRSVWCLLAVGICGLSIYWVVMSGKDLNWDALNYHIYAAHSLIEGRLSQDFFPASIQSYLNPIGYLPFYMMVKIGLHSLAIALILTLIHVVNIYLLYRLSKELLEECGSAAWYLLLSVFLALATSIYWSLLGSSFVDVIVTIPMLEALRRLFAMASRQSVSIAGMLMGVAVGLKLSCAVFAVPAVVVLLRLEPWGKVARSAAFYVAGGLLGFILAYGYWGHLLWSEFANPFFPFFNGVFGSSSFLPENINVQRYIPDTPLGLLSFPAKLALPAHWIYTESINPDIKPLVAFCVATTLIIATIFGGVRPSASRSGKDRSNAYYLSLFWLLSYFGWLITSANGRYGILLLFLSGPLIVVGIRALWPSGVKVISGTVLVIQLGILAVAGVPRWDEGEWSADWYNFLVPQSMKDKPALYLSAGNNSMSFLAVKFHPRSALINVSGQYSLAFNTPGGQRLAAMLEKHQEVRSLLPYEADYDLLILQGKTHAAGIYAEYHNGIYGRFGYRVTNDCEFIRQTSGRETAKTVLSCRLEKSETSIREYLSDKTSVQDIFLAVERVCRKLLQPVGGPPERMPFGWQKFYLNTDAKVKIMDGNVLLQRSRTMNPIFMGNVEAVLSGGAPIGATGCQ